MQRSRHSVIRLVRLARPHLIRSKGEIINVSSIAGLNFAVSRNALTDSHSYWEKPFAERIGPLLRNIKGRSRPAHPFLSRRPDWPRSTSERSQVGSKHIPLHSILHFGVCC